MLDLNHAAWPKRALPYLGCYLLYALLIALSVGALLVWRQAVLYALAAFVGPSAVNTLIFTTSMLLIGIALFLVVMGAEPYLRQGITRHEVGQRFLRMLLVVASIGAVGAIIQLGATISLR